MIPNENRMTKDDPAHAQESGTFRIKIYSDSYLFEANHANNEFAPPPCGCQKYNPNFGPETER